MTDEESSRFKFWDSFIDWICRRRRTGSGPDTPSVSPMWDPKSGFQLSMACSESEKLDFLPIDSAANAMMGRSQAL